MAYHPFRNLGLKFISVAIATALWFAVTDERSVERTLRVPLELQNTPSSLELVDSAPVDVDVRVRGGASQLGQIGASDVVAVLDLSSARPGRKYFHLTREQVRVPFGVDVTQVSPGTVALTFERSETRTVPVSPVIEGQPAEGYTIVSQASEPKDVRVSGPESAVKPLREAITDPVSVTGATGPVRETVTVGVPDARLRLERPVNATVLVDIQPVPVQRALMRVPVRVKNAGERLRVQVVPAAVTVLASGPKDVIDALEPDQIDAYVDVAGLKPGRYNRPVLVNAKDFTVVRTDPANVRVSVGR